jgi:hypothetical protein
VKTIWVYGTNPKENNYESINPTSDKSRHCEQQ